MTRAFAGGAIGGAGALELTFGDDDDDDIDDSDLTNRRNADCLFASIHVYERTGTSP